MNIAIARTLSDSELIAEVKRLAGCEREATARLIIHLAELERRQLHLGAGFRSLYEYCTEVLRLSEHETYKRLEAARALGRYPAILDTLLDGSLTLTTVRLLAPHLTPANQDSLLAAARGKSKRKVEELIAALAPKPESPPLIRKLPQPRQAVVKAGPPEEASIGTGDSPGNGSAAGVEQPQAAAPQQEWPVTPHRPPAPSPPRPVATPVAAQRYQIRFTASADTYEKLRVAQDLLRHAVPDGDPAQIFDRALTVLLEDLARKKFAATERPRQGRGAAVGSRHIPAAVKRAVWLRDRGRCGFLAADGRRCSARGFIEFHHTDPYGVGGKATVDKIELRCKSHNNYESRLYYGPMREYSAADAVKDDAATYSVRGGRSGTGDPVDRMSATRSELDAIGQLGDLRVPVRGFGRIRIGRERSKYRIVSPSFWKPSLL